jgi:hypothetical protein
MAVPNKRGPFLMAILVLTLSATGLSSRADEIRLKDGKKLYGVIVAYEDNMFKVKTDYGFVLVERTRSRQSFRPRLRESRNRHRPRRRMRPCIHQSQPPIRSHKLSQRSHPLLMLRPHR